MISISSFEKIEKPAFYSSMLLAVILFALGIYFSITSPQDYQQSDFVRIMYVHVPSAWMALGIYTFIALSSLVYLIWRNQFFDIMARNAGVIGAAFAFITLVTGSLWGKPVWGTWWVWDARLTSMLILFFFYLGYIALSHTVRDELIENSSPAILAVIGLINIPIVKYSVNIWSTLHQPASVLKLGGPSVHSSMLLPLILMFCASASLFVMLMVLRIRSELIRKKILRIRYISFT